MRAWYISYPFASSIKYTQTANSTFISEPYIVLYFESCSIVSESLQHHGLYNPWNSPGQNIGMGSYSLLQRIFPTQGSNPGLLNPGILHCSRILYLLSHQGTPRILECIAYPFSSGSFLTQESNQGLLPAERGIVVQSSGGGISFHKRSDLSHLQSSRSVVLPEIRDNRTLLT